jgi:phosphomannomutase
VIDTGNGTAGAFAPRIFRDAGLNVIEQFTELDPDFPNHEPDPARTDTVESGGKACARGRADMGLAFDGDGDRFGVVDEKGEVIWPDRYMILLARQVLERQPGGKIVFDVKCTQALEDDIRAHGGQPIMWKTGHSHIKAKLHEEKAALAGEMSGHIFFVENYYGFDDGIYSGLRFVEYVSGRNEPLSKIMAGTPTYLFYAGHPGSLRRRSEVRRGRAAHRGLEARLQTRGRHQRRACDLRRRLGSGARVIQSARAGAALRSAHARATLGDQANLPALSRQVPEADRHWENE